MEHTEMTSFSAVAETSIVPLTLELRPIGDSAAIRRLMDEVRSEQTPLAAGAAAYNRQHNRHNR